MPTTLREWTAKVPGGRWLLLALAFALLVVADYGFIGLSRIVDQRAGDVLLKINAAGRPQSDRVVIVDIDQRSLERMNELAGSWPWPRSVHGELIDHLERQGPRAIAFDILFNEPDVYRPEHDAAFADAVARHANVWLAMTLNNDGQGAWMSQMPPAVGAKPLTDPPVDRRVPLMVPVIMADHPEAMRGGLINFTFDSDHVGRRAALYRDRSGWRFPSLPARLLAAQGRPLPAEETVLLNWRSSWKHVSYSDLYLDSLREKPTRPQDEFKDKILLIGTSAPGLMDMRLTPMGATYPGVEILATAIDNLDRGDWLRELPRSTMLPVALALIALIAVALARNVDASRIGYGLLAITLIGVAIGWIALAGGTFIPVFGPLLFGWAFYIAGSGLAYLDERAQRMRTSGLFKRFLDPRVVAQLVARGDFDPRNSGELREVSVLFTDIRGFTALSRVSSPQEVVDMLNRYFSKQVQVVFRHGGTLDKFMGDAIMAFWGAPVATPDHARMAVAAALDMSAALVEMRGELGAVGAGLEIGIGIHTGPAIVGFIGSSDRLDYTVIGDTVNVASRIEGATKGIARVLVSEATRAAVGDAYEWRDCGAHSVKGVETPVQLYEPIVKSSSL